MGLNEKYDALFRELSNQKNAILQKHAQQIEERIAAIDAEMDSFYKREAMREATAKNEKMRMKMEMKQKQFEQQTVNNLINKVKAEWVEFKVEPFKLSCSQ